MEGTGKFKWKIKKEEKNRKQGFVTVLSKKKAGVLEDLDFRHEV